MAKTAEVTASTLWRVVRRRHYPSDVHYAIQQMGFAGYHGNSSRNYITDEWLDRYADTRGWTVQDVVDFGTSKAGRWVLDHEPTTYPQWCRTVDKYADDIRIGEYRGHEWRTKEIEVR